MKSLLKCVIVACTAFAVYLYLLIYFAYVIMDIDSSSEICLKSHVDRLNLDEQSL